MSTDPKSTLPPPLPQAVQQEVDEALAGGLGELNLRQLFAALLNALGKAERRAFLTRTSDDKANGFYDRSVGLGSIPLELQVPRTRSGQFRPPSLPPAYQRGYPEETQALLLGLLGSSRSINAAKAALRKLGLSCSDQELEAVAQDFVQELELRNSRPVDPDLLALFIDAKFVELKDGDRLRPATIYLAVGLGRDGKKRVLACVTKFGRENLEDWKLVLRGLLERGLRRLLLVVQDDFSGLLPITKGLFPRADVQLCVVHMQRNAKTHLSKLDAAEFQLRLRSLKTSWDEGVASAQFEQLCQRFDASYPTFMAELRKKKDHYLAFLKYPETLRRSFSTTNVVEAVNGQLERIRRNNGGYFHSEDTLKLKLGMAIAYLETGRWRRIPASISASLDQLNALFEARLEKE
jgi:transposase-like protein